VSRKERKSLSFYYCQRRSLAPLKYASSVAVEFCDAGKTEAERPLQLSSFITISRRNIKRRPPNLLAECGDGLSDPIHETSHLLFRHYRQHDGIHDRRIVPQLDVQECSVRTRHAQRGVCETYWDRNSMLEFRV
jgi:hypothetical protein